MRAAAALLLAATMACRAGTQDSSRPAAAAGSGSTSSAGACGQDGDELRTRDGAGCHRQQRAACKERGKLLCRADASGRCNAMLVCMLAWDRKVAGRSTDGTWACRLRGGGRIRADATLEQLSARARQRLEAASTTSMGEAADDAVEGGLERYATRPPASLPARQCLE